MWVNNPIHPETIEGEYSVRMRGVWTPQKSGYYSFVTMSLKLTIINTSGEIKKDNISEISKLKPSYLGQPYRYFEKGQTYNIDAEYSSREINMAQIRYKFHEEDALKNAVEAARQSDVAILFLGFSETLEREEQDRSPDLPENQLELLKAVKAVNPNVIVVLNTGSGVSIEPWGSQASAIIEAYYPGQEGGTAIADILFGDKNPSGKLPFTCMKQWKDSPVYGYYPEGPDEMVHYVEGIYVGYRWFDRQDTPEAAFPFGHGLSYTTFSYRNLTLSPDTTNTGNVTAMLQISNTGKRAGAEVVQLYIGDDHASVDRPVKELKGYKKVFLQPGETTTVQFKIHPDDLKFYDIIKHDWKAEPGMFTVYIGSSSRDIRQIGKFTLVGF
jgi:beta-glucosidase